MTNIILSIVIGISSSFVASLLFLSYLHSSIPRVKISNQIGAYNGDFYVKIVNLSRKSIFDLEFNLELIEFFHTKDGANMRATPLNLENSKIRMLSGTGSYKNKRLKN